MELVMDGDGMELLMDGGYSLGGGFLAFNAC